VTNRLAVILALLVIGFFVLDHFVLHWGAPLFLARKLADLTSWMAFWR
jgi:hypothetical protein